MAIVTSEQVAQDIYVMHSLNPNDKLSVTMARLPYSMLTKVLALAYGNANSMFSVDRKADTLTLSDAYQVTPDNVSAEIDTVLGQMAEMAMRYADTYEEHVSVGQFCMWAQVGPEFFPLLKAYAKMFSGDLLDFYTLENPYSVRGHEEEFIATPYTRDKEWGAKQFHPPKDKKDKHGRIKRSRP